MCKILCEKWKKYPHSPPSKSPFFHSRPFHSPSLLSFPPPSSIPAQAGISSRASGKFPRQRKRNVACRRCVADDAAPRDSRFRGNGSMGGNLTFPFPPHYSIPVSLSILAPLFHSRESGNLFPRQREISAIAETTSPTGECVHCRNEGNMRK